MLCLPPPASAPSPGGLHPRGCPRPFAHTAAVAAAARCHPRRGEHACCRGQLRCRGQLPWPAAAAVAQPAPAARSTAQSWPGTRGWRWPGSLRSACSRGDMVAQAGAGARCCFSTHLHGGPGADAPASMAPPILCRPWCSPRQAAGLVVRKWLHRHQTVSYSPTRTRSSAGRRSLRGLRCQAGCTPPSSNCGLQAPAVAASASEGARAAAIPAVVSPDHPGPHNGAE